MCGIAGIISNSFSPGPEQIKAMTDQLLHRGPEAEGFYVSEGIALGHRRLRIIDLSDAANQPMHSSDGRWVMVYNGELYNFKQLRELYLSKFDFKTESDTEVLLELIAHQGLDVLTELNGMFALALYDTLEEKLYLIRDSIGIKPLYYSWQNNTLCFGSELKSVMAAPHISHDLDHKALNLFLQLGYIPSPLTAFRHVYKLPPGHLLSYSKAKLELSKWSKVSFGSRRIEKEEEAIAQLDLMMKEVIKDQLVADVPVGLFLSGGVDSSLVAAYAARQSEGICTFSIGLENPQKSELPYASWVSKQLGTKHTELIVTPSQVIDLIPMLVDVYDEPYGDSSALPTLLVSELAKKHVTVSLSGDGGDELFLGYGIYQWPERLQAPLSRLAGQFVFGMLGKLRQDRWNKQANLFANGTSPKALFSMEHGYFSESEASQLIAQELNNERFEFTLFDKTAWKGLRLDEQQAFFDRCYYLPDDLLTKVDRASMRHSLEVRVPLLDQRMVHFSENLHPDLKWKNGMRKYLLRKLLTRELPGYDTHRPKQGFSIPLQEWLRGPLQGLIEDWLSPARLKETEVLDVVHTTQLVKKFQQGHNYLYHKIWLLIVLQQFLVNVKKAKVSSTV
jgi:asparagine synthase (glutamine-hydrolysing)